MRTRSPRWDTVHLPTAAFRDLVGTSRKYVIPLLDHLDDLGVTQRVENKRILRKK